LNGDETSTIRTEIQWPAAFRNVVIAPLSGTLKPPGGGGKATISARNAPGKCDLTHVFESSSAVVSPRDYPAMLDVQSALARKSSRVFLLEKTP
jgi:hypothetical protein